MQVGECRVRVAGFGEPLVRVMNEKPYRRGSAETMILVKDVYKSFGSNHVLRGLNLQVQYGESMVVIGGSGTGKSVLIKCIIGLLYHDRGEIHVGGQEISHLKEEEWNELRKKFGMLFQRDALFDSLPVWENVGFALRRHTTHSDDEIKAIAAEKLKLVGLENVENLMPAELSGGMRRRVSIARAIASEPSIMLYDSPTGGLDPVTAHTINVLIAKLRDVQSVTSLVVTHRLADAYALARFVYSPEKKDLVPASGNGGAGRHAPTNFLVLREGKVYFLGTTEEIVTSPDPYVRKFLE